MFKDPVCGMDVNPKEAAGKSEYKGHLLLLRARLQEGFRSEPREVRGDRLMRAPAVGLHRCLPLAIVVALMGVAVTAAACGGGSSAPAIRITPGAAGATLDMTVGDNFYKPNEFRVRAGQQVTLNVKNEAVHTVRLAGPDGQYETGDDTQVGSADDRAHPDRLPHVDRSEQDRRVQLPL